VTEAVPSVEGWRAGFRRHERALAAAWLGTLILGAGALAVPPVRVGILDGLQAVVDRWDERWTRRLARGEAMVARGEYDVAAAYLERLDAAFPARDVRHARDKQRERLLRLLGRSYEALDRKARAMATYDRLVAFDPLNYHNHFERARAAERLLSGWALAPEARDGYAAVLQLFPSHLPSVRGYIDYYMDRGEFIPVVQAYRDYLDAFLIQRVIIRLGRDSAVALLQVDGLPHDIELPLMASPGSPGPLSIHSGGFAVRVERLTLRPAMAVGVVGPAEPVELPLRPSALRGMEPAVSGALRPAGDGTLVEYAIPDLRAGVAGVHVRLRVYKPVDEELWQAVRKSYRNLLDQPGLSAASERTVPLSSVEAADAVIGHQLWAREGLEARLDDGQ
jgi:tetratricopeptide (TPR) repeat protein